MNPTISYGATQGVVWNGVWNAISIPFNFNFKEGDNTLTLNFSTERYYVFTLEEG